jgi:3'-phosphoadenosine 5'-phosphosulfate (PAPS) 3'-phosphatase
MWTLDPIDGTKGFLRGGQYAVCLALLIDARVELGVIGCPNLPSIPSASPSSYQSTSTSTNDNTSGSSTATSHADGSSANSGGTTGVLFVALRGHGAYQLPLLLPAMPPRPSHSPLTSGSLLNMPRLALHELSFLESVEKAHAALDTNARVAARLGVRAGPVRMDSQAKYAALVRGDGGGGVYLRLPVAGGGRGGEAAGYQEKIWVRYGWGGFFFTCVSVLFMCCCAGSRYGITPRRRSGRNHLRLSWASARFWSWAHARYELRCGCCEEGGPRSGDRSRPGSIGGRSDDTRG